MQKFSAKGNRTGFSGNQITEIYMCLYIHMYFKDNELWNIFISTSISTKKNPKTLKWLSKVLLN